MQGEVNAGDEHKDNRNQIDGGAIEITHTGVMGRETANRNGCEAVTDRIEQVHANYPVSSGTGNRQGEIDVP